MKFDYRVEIQAGRLRAASNCLGGSGRPTWMFSIWLGPVALLLFSMAIRSVSLSAPRDAHRVTVNPGDDIDALVQQQPPRTEFRIEAGLYRLQSISPKDGDSFVGEPGAILDGAQLLTGSWRSGRLWVARVRATRGSAYRGQCTTAHPACLYPEDLFIDDKPLLRVADREEVGPGKWYLDYSTKMAYFADNPNRHRVEMSVISHAFWGAAQNVRIAGLTIEKYACMAQDGAVDARSDSGQLSHSWVVENNVIRLNHGIGIRLGDAMQVLHNKLLYNGQLGVGGGGSNGIVDGNEIAFNNYAGYDYGWEAGGTKFAFTKNLMVRNNYVHDNEGPGLWTDLENEDTVYDHNQTKSNREAGILHEVSYHAVIRDNLIENDGFGASRQTTPWYGAGIIVAGSADVEVYGNTVRACMNGIVGTQPRRELSHRGTPYLLRNLYVHDNTITQGQGIAAGIVRAALLGDAVFTSWNNRFTHNQFHLADPGAKCFAWEGAVLSYPEWTLAASKY